MATAVPCLNTTCEEKQQLDDAVWRAVRELLALEDAGPANGPAPEKLLLARKLAVQRHDDAKRASLLHTCRVCCCC